MALSNQIVYLGDFAEEAKHRQAEYGRTGLFSTGVPRLDTYLGGGFGRKHGYEIVLLFGPTKIGKSTVALNLMAGAIKNGHRVGLMILEDEGADTYLRFTNILGADVTKRFVTEQKNVRCMPVDAMLKSWSLDDLLAKIEGWFGEGMDLILLDHINFAFENAETIKGENEYIKQRVFMRNLNLVMKRTGKTLIMVSHVGKANGNVGTDRVFGSSAIAAAATKIIEVKKDKLGTLYLHLHGSRFTATPDVPYPITLSGINRVKLEDGNLGNI